METLEPHFPKSESNSKSKPNSYDVNSVRSPATTPQPSPSSMLRLWRPVAQRNLRSQWSKMASYRQQWNSASSSGRTHATSLVNSYLSQRYMPSMELGALSDMPDIRTNACLKLFKKQEHYQRKLVASYKDMVTVVCNMVNTSRSMRCFLKVPTSSPLVQFSRHSMDVNDTGDGGGIPVFAFSSISAFEKLAEEFVQMFELELNLKRLLVIELLSIRCEPQQVNDFGWSDELYPGEFDDLSMCNMYCEETCQPVTPRLRENNSTMHSLPVQHNRQANQETLQVYLTTWLSEVNIDTHRICEIFTAIGEEMHTAMCMASSGYGRRAQSATKTVACVDGRCLKPEVCAELLVDTSSDAGLHNKKDQAKGNVSPPVVVSEEPLFGLWMVVPCLNRSKTLKSKNDTSVTRVYPCFVVRSRHNSRY